MPPLLISRVDLKSPGSSLHTRFANGTPLRIYVLTLQKPAAVWRWFFLFVEHLPACLGHSINPEKLRLEARVCAETEIGSPCPQTCRKYRPIGSVRPSFQPIGLAHHRLPALT